MDLRHLTRVPAMLERARQTLYCLREVVLLALHYCLCLSVTNNFTLPIVPHVHATVIDLDAPLQRGSHVILAFPRHVSSLSHRHRWILG